MPSSEGTSAEHGATKVAVKNDAAVDESSAPQETHPSKRDLAASSRREKPEVLLAFIQHGSRPLAYCVLGILAISWLFTVRKPLFEFLERAQVLKFGSFEISVQEAADKSELTDELARLKELSDAQLRLFLAIGAQRKDAIRYDGPEVTLENLNKLQSIDLLKDVKKTETGPWSWNYTESGARLHNLLMRQITKAIRKAA